MRSGPLWPFSSSHSDRSKPRRRPISRRSTGASAQHAAKGNYAAALVEAKKLEAAVMARFGSDSEQYAGVLDNLAFLHATLGQYDEAEQLFRRVLAWREKKDPDDVPVARTLDLMAKMYVDQSRFAEAEPLMRRALAIVGKSLPSSHPFAAKVVNDLAVVVEQQGKYVEAEFAVQARDLDP